MMSLGYTRRIWFIAWQVMLQLQVEAFLNCAGVVSIPESKRVLLRVWEGTARLQCQTKTSPEAVRYATSIFQQQYYHVPYMVRVDHCVIFVVFVSCLVPLVIKLCHQAGWRSSPTLARDACAPTAIGHEAREPSLPKWLMGPVAD